MSWRARSADSRLSRTMRFQPPPKRGRLHALDEAHVAAHRFGTFTVFLIFMIVVFLAFTVYFAAYSGALRWLVFALLLALAAVGALQIAGRASADPIAVEPPKDPEGGTGGSLRSLRTTFGRAAGGLRYSQIVFEDRLARAFLEKVKAVRAVELAAEDPRLEDLIRDEELAAFVRAVEASRKARQGSAPVLPSGAAFRKRTEALMKRMEAWS